MEQDQVNPVQFVDHPACPYCGKPQWRIRIEPVLGCEKCTYECRQCGHKESILTARTSPLRNRVE